MSQSTSKWEFLSPWLQALAPYLAIELCDPLHDRTEDDGAEAFSIVPRVKRIQLTLSEKILEMTEEDRRCELKTLRHAMVLVGQALRVDASVWSLLKLGNRQLRTAQWPTRVDHRLFRTESFESTFCLSIVLCTHLYWERCSCVRLRKRLELLRGLFDDTTSDDAEDNAFRAALKTLRVLQAEHHATAFVERLKDKDRLVSVEFDICGPSYRDEYSTPDIASTLEAICSSRWVCGYGLGRGLGLVDGQQFKVTQIRLKGWGLDELTSVLIARIRALGVSIPSVDVGFNFENETAASCLRTLTTQDPERPNAAGLHTLGVSIHYRQPARNYGLLFTAATACLRALNLKLRLECLHPLELRFLHQFARDVLTRQRHGVRSLELVQCGVIRIAESDWLADPPIIRESVRIDSSTGEGAALNCKLARLGLQNPVNENTVFEKVRLYDRSSDSHTAALLIHPNGQLVFVPRASVQAALTPIGCRGKAVEALPCSTRTASTRASPTAYDGGVQVLSCTHCCFLGNLVHYVRLLTMDFSGLRSLEFHCASIDPFTAPMLTTVLRAFPSLEALALRATSLESLDVVLDAASGGLCSRLRVLSVDSGHIGFVSFFEALTDPHFGLSQTLEELKINFVDDEEGAYLRSITELLTQNRVLQFLELALDSGTSEVTARRIAAALRRFHRVPVAVRNPHLRIAVRCRLACLSVFSRQRQLEKVHLNSDVMSLIWVFAAPMLDRLVHLKQVTENPTLNLDRDFVGDLVDGMEAELVSYDVDGEDDGGQS